MVLEKDEMEKVKKRFDKRWNRHVKSVNSINRINHAKEVARAVLVCNAHVWYRQQSWYEGEVKHYWYGRMPITAFHDHALLMAIAANYDVNNLLPGLIFSVMENQGKKSSKDYVESRNLLFSEAKHNNLSDELIKLLNIDI